MLEYMSPLVFFDLIRESLQPSTPPYDPPYRSAYHKLKFITAILLAAYTGQRPQATIDKTTFEDLEEALKRDPPML